MILVEFLYDLKKKVKKIYRDYFTIDGTYTSLLPDRIYIKQLYKKRMGKNLNLKNPTTYNEKLNWLKLYNRCPEYTKMVDKYAVREYVEKSIGQKYLIPLIGSWDSVDDIELDELPEQFVLKCNHDNGVIICRNKKILMWDSVKKELEYHLNRDYYKKAREWPYKNVKRKIICEKYICESDRDDLTDYKFFCFDGKVKIVCIIMNRSCGGTIDYFDINFNRLDLRDKMPNSTIEVKKPDCFEEMMNIASKLARNIPHVRVDLYCVEGKIYFGEMTFFDDAGFGCKEPEHWEKQLGNWIQLPKRKIR